MTKQQIQDGKPQKPDFIFIRRYINEKEVTKSKDAVEKGLIPKEKLNQLIEAIEKLKPTTEKGLANQENLKILSKIQVCLQDLILIDKLYKNEKGMKREALFKIKFNLDYANEIKNEEIRNIIIEGLKDYAKSKFSEKILKEFGIL